MSQPHVIRPLAIGDLADLEALCFEHARYEKAPPPAPGLAEQLRQLFFRAQARERCWVAEGDGELAGFATAAEEMATWEGGHYVHMDCLYLREAYRGRGLGRRLMETVAGFACERSAVNLQWQTPAWNEGAIRFYARLGASAADKQRFTLAGQALADLAQPSPTGRHRIRATRRVNVLEHAGWRVKQYHITLDPIEVGPQIVDAAERVVRQHLEQVEPSADVGVGFSILHPGEEAVWLLIDLWRGDILYQLVYSALLAEQDQFDPVPAGGASGCVWELDVVAHERSAFVRHILDPAGGPRPDDYLADVLYRRSSGPRTG